MTGQHGPHYSLRPMMGMTMEPEARRRPARGPASTLAMFTVLGAMTGKIFAPIRGRHGARPSSPAMRWRRRAWPRPWPAPPNPRPRRRPPIPAAAAAPLRPRCKPKPKPKPKPRPRPKIVKGERIRLGARPRPGSPGMGVAP